MFELDQLFARNLRTSRRRAAGGPSGTTTEHLRHELFTAIDLIIVGRLTALSKPDGGVRGTVASDVIRRLVARTMSQQLSEAVERGPASICAQGWLRVHRSHPARNHRAPPRTDHHNN